MIKNKNISTVIQKNRKIKKTRTGNIKIVVSFDETNKNGSLIIFTHYKGKNLEAEPQLRIMGNLLVHVQYQKGKVFQ